MPSLVINMELHSEVYASALIDEIIKEKEKQDLTVQELADMSDIPPATISKLLNHSTNNPSAITILALAKVLNISIDTILGIKFATDDEKSTADGYENTVKNHPCIAEIHRFEQLYKGQYERLIEEYEKRIQDKTLALRHKDKWIMSEAIAIAAIITAIICYLIYDITHPQMGIFRADLVYELKTWLDVIL